MTATESNKRIAKNTLLLYIRMLLLMAVTLYTSRVILQVLGVEDFGIYNVVGGVVTMFAFINGGMVSATQRYISFELGRKDKEKLQKVFTTAVQIHGVISIIIVLLAETFGLWFFYNKMVIPADRITAGMWVYQCSVLACIVNIMAIPYNATIIAHEKMSAFAYISIIEAVLKLGVVFVLICIPYDKLIIYSFLILIVQLTIRTIYTSYSHRHFTETKYKNQIDFALFKEMASFAGWSFWGNLAVVLYTQGINLILNVFFGPLVNAARAIAVQVQGAVQQFVANFQMALNPQITKSYSVGDFEQMHTLMFRSARFSFFLLFLLTLPVLLETKFILNIWLESVPENSIIFTQLMICISLIYTTANPCVVANQATGKVKLYQLVVGGFLLMILPISYIVLLLGAPAYSVFIVHFCIELFAQFLRMLLLKKIINLPIRAYVKNIYLPILTTLFVSIILPIWVRFQFDVGWCRFFIVTLTSLVCTTFTILILGLTHNERNFIIHKIVSKFKKVN